MNLFFSGMLPEFLYRILFDRRPPHIQDPTVYLTPTPRPTDLNNEYRKLQRTLEKLNARMLSIETKLNKLTRDLRYKRITY